MRWGGRRHNSRGRPCEPPPHGGLFFDLDVAKGARSSELRPRRRPARQPGGALLEDLAVLRLVLNDSLEGSVVLGEVFLGSVLRHPSTSRTFTQRVKDAELMPSVGRTGTALDNAMMESFWGRMQVKLLNRRRWKTRVELANAIFEYIESFHNIRRRHSSLNMLTPTEFKKLHQKASSMWILIQRGRRWG